MVGSEANNGDVGIRGPIRQLRRHPARPTLRVMSLQVNLRLLEKGDLHLDGDVPASELAPDFHDELMRLSHPIEYELNVQKQSAGLLVTGTLRTHVDCECSRCLRPFLLTIRVDGFSLLAPLEGEDALPVDGDFADLTPAVREDILITLPANPLCSDDCRGLDPKARSRGSQAGDQAGPNTAWSALDRLKLG